MHGCCWRSLTQCEVNNTRAGRLPRAACTRPKARSRRTATDISVDREAPRREHGPAMPRGEQVKASRQKREKRQANLTCRLVTECNRPGRLAAYTCIAGLHYIPCFHVAISNGFRCCSLHVSFPAVADERYIPLFSTRLNQHSSNLPRLRGIDTRPRHTRTWKLQ